MTATLYRAGPRGPARQGASASSRAVVCGARHLPRYWTHGLQPRTSAPPLAMGPGLRRRRTAHSCGTRALGVPGLTPTWPTTRRTPTARFDGCSHIRPTRRTCAQAATATSPQGPGTSWQCPVTPPISGATGTGDAGRRDRAANPGADRPHDSAGCTQLRTPALSLRHVDPRRQPHRSAPRHGLGTTPRATELPGAGGGAAWQGRQLRTENRSARSTVS